MDRAEAYCAIMDGISVRNEIFREKAFVHMCEFENGDIQFYYIDSDGFYNPLHCAMRWKDGYKTCGGKIIGEIEKYDYQSNGYY